MAPDLSACCAALVTVVGDTTQHWECRACQQPCDLMPVGQPVPVVARAVADDLFRLAFGKEPR